MKGMRNMIDPIKQAERGEPTIDWELLYRRMRNVAAGYSNFCEETGSTRRLEREYEQIENDARALKAAS